MHKTFKVRYKEGDVYIAISSCVHKLYSILETGFVIKQVQMNLQSTMMLDHMSRSQLTVLGSFILTCVTLQEYVSLSVGVNSV